MNLHIKNIGPFQEAFLDFATEFNKETVEPVTIITGINDAGKSILIDAIRAVFGGMSILERDIIADEKDYQIKMEYEENRILSQKVCLISSKKGPTLACQP